MLKFFAKLFKWIVAPLIVISSLGIVALAAFYFYYMNGSSLPSVNELRNAQLQLPIQVYSREDKLIAEFGRFRRRPVSIDEIPHQMINAFIAIEDARFYQHKGVDLKGIIRAVVTAIKNRHLSQGASTITMQLARNFFLSSEKTLDRKIKEMFLAFKIEKELSKEEILALYLNKIYLGKRAYGVGSAAEIYYGKTLKQLTLAETAMIAGLPKAPSKYNPINRPKRALQRRNYILKRMLEQHYIRKTEYEQSVNEKITAKVHYKASQTYAPYMAEMARVEILKRYDPNDVYTLGLKIYTTLDSKEQALATRTLRQHLLKYTRRHGYRGAEDHIDIDTFDQTALQKKLSSYKTYASIYPALVVSVNKKQAILRINQQAAPITLTLPQLAWARRYINENRRGSKVRRVSDVLKRGDIIRVQKNKKGKWRFTQIPKVTGALVSLDPKDGAIRAIAGGFDFTYSKFNRAIQAKRQPGSSFKPFIYSAALAKNFSPASLIDDAPMKIPGSKWNPQNYGHKFGGLTRLRVALAKSKNLVSIHLLENIGIQYAISYATKFGFKKERLPANLTLALGTGSSTPLEMATAYAPFANGGYKVDSYFIRKIKDKNDRVLFQSQAKIACTACPTPRFDQVDERAKNSKFAKRIMKPYVHYQIASMLQDVTRVGTAARATRILKRTDIAGKTGTTNDQKDAWFCGFTPKKVTTVWMGFDKVKPLGSHETATQAALPIWIDFMKATLAGTKNVHFERPKGLKRVVLDATTSLHPNSLTTATIKESLTPKQMPSQKARLKYQQTNRGRMDPEIKKALDLALKEARTPRHRERLIREAEQRQKNLIRRRQAQKNRLAQEGKTPQANFNLKNAADEARLEQLMKEIVEIPEQLF